MTDRPDPSLADPWGPDPAATQRTALPDRAGPHPTWPAPSAPPAPGTAPAPGGPASATPATPMPEPATSAGWSAAPVPSGSWQSRRRDDGRLGSVVFGLILLAIGIWFFVEQTLGFDLPELRWDELWPLILIAIGLWVVLGAWRAER